MKYYTYIQARKFLRDKFENVDDNRLDTALGDLDYQLDVSIHTDDEAEPVWDEEELMEMGLDA